MNLVYTLQRDGERICDLDTTPHWAGNIGSHLSCITTHNVFFALLANRVVLADEELLSHGISVFEDHLARKI